VAMTIDNEDWLRYKTWDVYRLGTPVTTLPDFFWVLGVSSAPVSEQKEALVHAMTLPSWVPAPKSLKDEAEEFLKPLQGITKATLTKIERKYGSVGAYVKSVIQGKGRL